MMRVLICGGRDFDNYELVKQTLDEFHGKTPIYAIIHGNARGADRLSGIWATTHNSIRVWLVPAQWAKFGKSAGPRRNQAMLGMSPDVVIAFPGGRGTADLVRRAKEAGIKVIEVQG